LSFTRFKKKTFADGNSKPDENSSELKYGTDGYRGSV